MTELFVIAGPAGSGKTTLGVALATRLAAPWLDLDDATLGLVAAYRSDHPDVSEAEALSRLREDRYAALAAQARHRVRLEAPGAIVLIAPFTREIASPERWAQLAEAVGLENAQAHLVWLRLPVGERLARMSDRGATRDADLLAEAERGLAPPEPDAPVVPALAVDALLPTHEQVNLVMQRFGNGQNPL